MRPPIFIVVAGLLLSCSEAEETPDPRADRRSAREVPTMEAVAADPGPRVWRPRRDGRPEHDDRTTPAPRAASPRPTPDEVRARFAKLRSEDPELGTCQMAFEALRETRQGMGELLDGRALGGPNRADYLTLCRALPAEVQRCMTPAYQATNQEGCDRTLRRFGADRENPQWLSALIGRPATDRPAPATSEAEGRAIARRRRGPSAPPRNGPDSVP